MSEHEFEREVRRLTIAYVERVYRAHALAIVKRRLDEIGRRTLARRSRLEH
jgi:hypothetical protein